MSQVEGQEIHKEEKSTGGEHGGEAAEEERLPLKVLDARKKKKRRGRFPHHVLFSWLPKFKQPAPEEQLRPGIE